MPELFVTNYNPHFTGVSATTANVVRQQVRDYDMALVGQPLPGCPAPLSRTAAHRASWDVPNGKPFAIWHVRRNPEMRSAIWLRDVRRAPTKLCLPCGTASAFGLSTLVDLAHGRGHCDDAKGG